MNPTQLIDELRNQYGERRRAEFDEEAPTYERMIPALLTELEKRSYEVEAPFALGSTATIWLVRDKSLGGDGAAVRRVLKLTRPRRVRGDKIVEIIRNEGTRLADLNHQNIVRVYETGEVPVNKRSYPFFVMDYFDDFSDLDDFIQGDPFEVALALPRIVRDVLRGIEYLHAKGLIHCDIKPMNILVLGDGSAVITDFGYSKQLVSSVGSIRETDIYFTKPFAHPALIEAIKNAEDTDQTVASARLKEVFDLYAMGRTIQYGLARVERAIVGSGQTVDLEERSVRRLLQFMSYVAQRLLDGQRTQAHMPTQGPLSAVIQGLDVPAMRQIRYRSASEAIPDLSKLLSEYDIEARVPELSPHCRRYTQIPACQPPMTARVAAVVNHPTFARLSQVSQLGFVSLVYPGARHTRFEHVLGTFASACSVLRALWYDDTNPLFQCVMTQRDLETCLVAALVHDVGQYAMAHDLTECWTKLRHEQCTERMLEAVPAGSQRSLADVIRQHWGVETHNLLAVLGSEDRDLKQRILHAVISGPLDCDKLDYLRRDSIHLGVPFGESIDQDRLVRNLTIAYTETSACLGVAEKALAVVHQVWKARQDLYMQVYWHHTVRALKSMLAFGVRAWVRDTPEEARKQLSERILNEFMWPLTLRYRAFLNCQEQIHRMSVHTEVGDDADYLGDPDTSPQLELAPSSHLDASDEAAVMFIAAQVSIAAAEVLELLRRRSIYLRYSVLSPDGSGSGDEDRERRARQYTTIYEHHRVWTMSGDLDSIEDARSATESVTVELLCGWLDIERGFVRDPRDVDALQEQIRTVDPLVLVDVPIKATSPLGPQDKLYYVPELDDRKSSATCMPMPTFEEAPVADMEQTKFDQAVGRIRIFAHPEWKQLLVRSVREDIVVRALASGAGQVDVSKYKTGELLLEAADRCNRGTESDAQSAVDAVLRLVPDSSEAQELVLLRLVRCHVWARSAQLRLLDMAKTLDRDASVSDPLEGLRRHISLVSGAIELPAETRKAAGANKPRAIVAILDDSDLCRRMLSEDERLLDADALGVIADCSLSAIALAQDEAETDAVVGNHPVGKWPRVPRSESIARWTKKRHVDAFPTFLVVVDGELRVSAGSLALIAAFLGAEGAGPTSGTAAENGKGS